MEIIILIVGTLLVVIGYLAAAYTFNQKIDEIKHQHSLELAAEWKKGWDSGWECHANDPVDMRFCLQQLESKN